MSDMPFEPVPQKLQAISTQSMKQAARPIDIKKEVEDPSVNIADLLK